MSARAAFAALMLAVSFAAVGPAHAVQPDEILADPALERRARALSAELRCLVCQNQSIDDSDAPLARDLRLLVRERLKAGDSDAEAMAFITARYGDFVLLKPPLKGETLILWLAPAALLLGAIVFVVAISRRRTSPVQEPGARLSAAEETRLAEITRRDEPR